MFFVWLVWLNSAIFPCAPPNQTRTFPLYRLPHCTAPVCTLPVLPSHSPPSAPWSIYLGFEESVAPRKPGQIAVCRGFLWVIRTETGVANMKKGVQSLRIWDIYMEHQNKWIWVIISPFILLLFYRTQRIYQTVTYYRDIPGFIPSQLTKKWKT